MDYVFADRYSNVQYTFYDMQRLNTLSYLIIAVTFCFNLLQFVSCVSKNPPTFMFQKTVVPYLPLRIYFHFNGHSFKNCYCNKVG